MLTLALIAWMVSAPELTMQWTPSDPPAARYVVIAEYDTGDTEVIGTTETNRIKWRLKWLVISRLMVVPIANNRIHWEQASPLSDRYLWGRLRLYMNFLPTEVGLRWDNTKETTTVFSTTDLVNWKVEDVVPAGVTRWWDADIFMKQKYYKIGVEHGRDE